MVRFSLKSALLLLVVFAMSSVQHKFYLSKTTVEYNTSSGMYEGTIKFFTDDLENALTNKTGKSISFSKMNEAEIDQILSLYVTDRLEIQLDQVPLNWRLVGHETENDITYCYFEGYAPQAFNQVSIRCDFMTELFADQQNLIDFKAHGKTQSLVLTKDRNRGVLGS